MTPTIGIITALSHETAAVLAMLNDPKRIDMPGSGAGRVYWLAEIQSPFGGVHGVAVAQADVGNNIAAVRGTQLASHFPTVESVIMCGIAGGIAQPGKLEQVRLGDIVVSNQKGIVQYDFVKRTIKKNRREVAEEVRASPHRPSALLLEAVRILETGAHFGEYPWEDRLRDGLPRLGWMRPDGSTDILSDSSQSIITDSDATDPRRRRDQPRVFLAPIASANTLLKDPAKRDALHDQFGVKAVEMEGSGIQDATWTQGIGYLVVRGICDYCDKNKNDLWQNYAAMAAAAYVLAILESMPGEKVPNTALLDDADVRRYEQAPSPDRALRPETSGRVDDTEAVAPRSISRSQVTSRIEQREGTYSTISANEFVREYTEAILDDRAAVFVGAGFSMPAGFVDWKRLLKDIASDLGLDIHLEHDLMAVAQYEYNRRGGRDNLNRTILDHFAKHASLTQSHELLARLPIRTVWTTNYDGLLEQAFVKAGKRVDVKRDVGRLKCAVPYADVTIYKMHGDAESPEQAVLTKDDYERYDVDRAAFVTQLQADLLAKSFLFLGFSFTDPNIEAIVNRLRRMLRTADVSPKAHLCLLRPPQKGEGIDLSLERQRFRHRVDDLKRLGVGVVEIRDYGEVPELLRKLNRRVNSWAVMFSGAATDYEPWGREKLERFCFDMGARLIAEGYNIVSGSGLGISSALLMGGYSRVQRADQARMHQRLRLFPFPVGWRNEEERKAYYLQNRREIAANSGVSVFISGNKLVTERGKGRLIESQGVWEEYEEAVRQDHLLIPVGATGHASASIHRTLSADKKVMDLYKSLGILDDFRRIGDVKTPPNEIIDAVVRMIERYREGGRGPAC